MLVIMFYVWVAQAFVVVSKFTAANNVRYFVASVALAAWIAVVWAFWGIAGMHWDT